MEMKPYPCGCEAGPAESVPDYCPEHGEPGRRNWEQTHGAFDPSHAAWFWHDKYRETVARVAELEAMEQDSRFARSDWGRAHDLLDAHGVLTTPQGHCGNHLIDRIEAVLNVWDAIGKHSGQCCEDLKYLCNSTPEVTEAIRAYRDATR